MTIGIDISQLAFKNIGVANYLSNLVLNILKNDTKNQYVLFFSSLRDDLPPDFNNKITSFPNAKIKKFKFPPTFLDLLWNRLHIFPIENLLGQLDIFITSDWTHPPAKRAKKVTIIYDLTVYKYPHETHGLTEFNMKKFLIYPNIVDIQKRCHKWVARECDMVLCISESTRKDAGEILGIPKEKLKVVYPGI